MSHEQFHRRVASAPVRNSSDSRADFGLIRPGGLSAARQRRCKVRKPVLCNWRATMRVRAGRCAACFASRSLSASRCSQRLHYRLADAAFRATLDSFESGTDAAPSPSDLRRTVVVGRGLRIVDGARPVQTCAFAHRSRPAGMAGRGRRGHGRQHLVHALHRHAGFRPRRPGHLRPTADPRVARAGAGGDVGRLLRRRRERTGDAP